MEEVRLAVPVRAEEERPAVLARVAADQREAAASPALAAARELHGMPVRTRKGNLRRTAGTMTTTKQRLEGFSRSRALRGGNDVGLSAPSAPAVWMHTARVIVRKCRPLSSSPS
jgi:hypothetical protein